MNKWKPVPKMQAVLLGGAAATVVVWVIEATSAATISGPVAAAFAALLTFVFGYLKEPGDGEVGMSAIEALAVVALILLVLWFAGALPSR